MEMTREETPDSANAPAARRAWITVSPVAMKAMSVPSRSVIDLPHSKTVVGALRSKSGAFPKRI
jgi:hypothetical protein